MGAVDELIIGLDQRQRAIVRRDYSGPAQLAGTAGTGKTVVALHRLARLARRTTGRLLYLANLPRVQAAAYQRLAPASAHRVEFTTVCVWARDLLLRRGIPSGTNPSTVDEAFARAWARSGQALAGVVADPTYWREEIDHVIKGGGVTTASEYLRLPRHGRRPALSPEQRVSVWDLYCEYQSLLSAAGVRDHNDVLLAATASLRERPLDPPYTAVVADEAQDLGLVGLRLLHEVGGDGPNGLLLVGDGRQAVYPAGGRFSDAGIPIQGRGDVLRVNYRNAVAVRAVARVFGEVGGDAAGPARADGIAEHYVASCPEDHDVELVTALRTCRVAPADIAVLTPTGADAEHYRRVLQAAQIAAVNLADCAGQRVGAVKVGTIRRATGLEFKAVFLPWLRSHPAADGLASRKAFVAVTRAREYVWTGNVVATA
jgi:hypothetical protein